MLYLLDANILIHAKNQYYPIDRVPEFWAWLVHQGEQGNIKIPIEIYEEFKDTKPKDGDKDELANWADQADVKAALLFDEEADTALVQQVTYDGYLQNPTDADIVKLGRDPFLISYGLAAADDRTIVTAEVSKPTLQAANRRVPDVCNSLGIQHINSFELIQVLDFRTGWR